MASMSNSSIETIVQCLTKAVEAARNLDSSRSQNLCFALNIANSEAGRVARGMKKPSSVSASASAKKPAVSAKKPAAAPAPAKQAKKAEKSAPRAIVAPKQTKSRGQVQVQGPSRRKHQSLNGAVAH
jgi:hypothetical protein